MKRKRNNIRVRFSTILLCILGLLLCSSTSGWADDYDDGGIHDVTLDEVFINIWNATTVNLHASVSQDIHVGSGCFLNIHSGNVGMYITVEPGPPSAVVTVYGTGFGGDGDLSVAGQVTFSSGSGTLTGLYGDSSDINLLFYSTVPIYLAAPEISIEEVEIDIKPGSYPNSINLKSKGVVPVAVLTSVDFDATTVDPATVQFAGASPLRWTLEDVDDDGDEDMLFHFKTQQLNLDENSTEATLTGQTNDGGGISGTDEVRIVGSRGTSAVYVSKCNVKADKSIGQDTISFSGQLDATENDLLNADPAEVVVSIDAADMPDPLTFTFPINNVSFKNGTYNYSRTENASKLFFKFNTKNGKVNFNAKKVDLTGLACPVTVTVTIGSYSTTLQLDEDIVNGPKRPCPPQLLMGVKNSLTVGKAKVKFSKKPNTDSLSVKGFFTIEGMNYDKTNPLVIVLGNQTFTVPGNQIITKRTIERCSKAQSNEGPYVSVRFDFSKCKYSIAIKKADITEYGTVDFGIQLFDKALLGFANLDL